MAAAQERMVLGCPAGGPGSKQEHPGPSALPSRWLCLLWDRVQGGPWALGAEDGGERWCPSAPVTLRVLREDSVTRGMLAEWRGQSSVAPLFPSDASGSVLPSLRRWS